MSEPKNIQLDWLKAASPETKPFVAMVIGWQTVAETINATVMRFNAKFFEVSDSPHHEMKVIAAKQMVMASLKELLNSLGNWRNKLASEGHLSDQSKALWKQLDPTLRQIHQFRDIRNCAFHFGDFVEAADDLTGMYEDIRDKDIESLNKMLRALYDFGLQLQQDAHAQIDSFNRK